MEFLNKLDDLIIEFVQGSPGQLQEMYHTGTPELVFLVPAWIIKCIEVGGHGFSMETKITVRGVRLLPNYEDSLVLYPPEYGLYKDNRYIRKVSLIGGYNPTDRKLIVSMKSLLKLALPENPLDSSFLP
jgi:hypothetical protein